MNAQQIKTRRLEIAVEMGRLAEHDCELRRMMLDVETAAAALNREVAELDLLDNEIQSPAIRPQPKVTNGR